MRGAGRLRQDPADRESGSTRPQTRAPARLAARRRRVLLAAIVLLALLVRAAAVHRSNSHALNIATRLSGDEPEYDGFARNLLNGHWADYPIRGPGYPALLAVLRVISGGSYDVILYLQAVLGALTVLPAYALARRIAGDLGGLLCAAGVALYWELALGSAYLQSEVLFTPLLLLFLLVLFRAFDRPTSGRWVAAGVCLGATAVTRPTMLPLIVPLALLVVFLSRTRRVGLRAAGVLTAAAIVVVLPVTVANAVKFHAFVPVATTTGVVWQGSPAYYDLYRSGRTYTSIWDHELNPAVNGGHSVATPSGDAYFTRKGLASIRAHPLTYGLYSLQKVGFFWLGHPSADWNNGTLLDPGSLHLARPERMLVMLDRTVPLVALAAILVLVWRRRRDRELLVIYGLLASFTALHAALWAELRLSQPLAPLLFALIAAALTAAGRSSSGSAKTDPPPRSGGC